MSGWADNFNANKIADPVQCLKDCREAHAYVSRELESTSNPQRAWNLGQEKKRLAGIAWALKRVGA